MHWLASITVLTALTHHTICLPYLLKYPKFPGYTTSRVQRSSYDTMPPKPPKPAIPTDKHEINNVKYKITHLDPKYERYSDPAATDGSINRLNDLLLKWMDNIGVVDTTKSDTLDKNKVTQVKTVQTIESVSQASKENATIEKSSVFTSENGSLIEHRREQTKKLIDMKNSRWSAETITESKYVGDELHESKSNTKNKTYNSEDNRTVIVNTTETVKYGDMFTTTTNRALTTQATETDNSDLNNLNRKISNDTYNEQTEITSHQATKTLSTRQIEEYSGTTGTPSTTQSPIIWLTLKPNRNKSIVQETNDDLSEEKPAVLNDALKDQKESTEDHPLSSKKNQDMSVTYELLPTPITNTKHYSSKIPEEPLTTDETHPSTVKTHMFNGGEGTITEESSTKGSINAHEHKIIEDKNKTKVEDAEINSLNEVHDAQHKHEPNMTTQLPIKASTDETINPRTNTQVFSKNVSNETKLSETTAPSIETTKAVQELQTANETTTISNGDTINSNNKTHPIHITTEPGRDSVNASQSNNTDISQTFRKAGNNQTQILNETLKSSSLNKNITTEFSKLNTTDVNKGVNGTTNNITVANTTEATKTTTSLKPTTHKATIKPTTPKRQPPKVHYSPPRKRVKSIWEKIGDFFKGIFGIRSLNSGNDKEAETEFNYLYKLYQITMKLNKATKSMKYLDTKTIKRRREFQNFDPKDIDFIFYLLILLRDKEVTDADVERHIWRKVRAHLLSRDVAFDDPHREDTTDKLVHDFGRQMPSVEDENKDFNITMERFLYDPDDGTNEKYNIHYDENIAERNGGPKTDSDKEFEISHLKLTKVKDHSNGNTHNESEEDCDDDEPNNEHNGHEMDHVIQHTIEISHTDHDKDSLPSILSQVPEHIFYDHKPEKTNNHEHETVHAGDDANEPHIVLPKKTAEILIEHHGPKGNNKPNGPKSGHHGDTNKFHLILPNKNSNNKFILAHMPDKGHRKHFVGVKYEDYETTEVITEPYEITMPYQIGSVYKQQYDNYRKNLNGEHEVEHIKPPREENTKNTAADNIHNLPAKEQSTTEKSYAVHNIANPTKNSEFTEDVPNKPKENGNIEYFTTKSIGTSPEKISKENENYDTQPGEILEIQIDDSTERNKVPVYIVEKNINKPYEEKIIYPREEKGHDTDVVIKTTKLPNQAKQPTEQKKVQEVVLDLNIKKHKNPPEELKPKQEYDTEVDNDHTEKYYTSENPVTLQPSAANLKRHNTEHISPNIELGVDSTTENSAITHEKPIWSNEGNMEHQTTEQSRTIIPESYIRPNRDNKEQHQTIVHFAVVDPQQPHESTEHSAIGKPKKENENQSLPNNNKGEEIAEHYTTESKIPESGEHTKQINDNSDNHHTTEYKEVTSHKPDRDNNLNNLHLKNQISETTSLPNNEQGKETTKPSNIESQKPEIEEDYHTTEYSKVTSPKPDGHTNNLLLPLKNQISETFITDKHKDGNENGKFITEVREEEYETTEIITEPYLILDVKQPHASEQENSTKEHSTEGNIKPENEVYTPPNNEQEIAEHSTKKSDNLQNEKYIWQNIDANGPQITDQNTISPTLETRYILENNDNKIQQTTEHFTNSEPNTSKHEHEEYNKPNGDSNVRHTTEHSEVEDRNSTTEYYKEPYTTESSIMSAHKPEKEEPLPNEGKKGNYQPDTEKYVVPNISDGKIQQTEQTTVSYPNQENKEHKTNDEFQTTVFSPSQKNDKQNTSVIINGEEYITVVNYKLDDRKPVRTNEDHIVEQSTELSTEQKKEGNITQNPENINPYDQRKEEPTTEQYKVTNSQQENKEETSPITHYEEIDPTEHSVVINFHIIEEEEPHTTNQNSENGTEEHTLPNESHEQENNSNESSKESEDYNKQPVTDNKTSSDNGPIQLPEPKEHITKKIIDQQHTDKYETTPVDEPTENNQIKYTTEQNEESKHNTDRIEGSTEGIKIIFKDNNEKQNYVSDLLNIPSDLNPEKQFYPQESPAGTIRPKQHKYNTLNSENKYDIHYTTESQTTEQTVEPSKENKNDVHADKAVRNNTKEHTTEISKEQEKPETTQHNDDGKPSEKHRNEVTKEQTPKPNIPEHTTDQIEKKEQNNNSQISGDDFDIASHHLFDECNEYLHQYLLQKLKKEKNKPKTTGNTTEPNMNMTISKVPIEHQTEIHNNTKTNPEDKIAEFTQRIYSEVEFYTPESTEENTQKNNSHVKSKTPKPDEINVMGKFEKLVAPEPNKTETNWFSPKINFVWQAIKKRVVKVKKRKFHVFHKYFEPKKNKTKIINESIYVEPPQALIQNNTITIYVPPNKKIKSIPETPANPPIPDQLVSVETTPKATTMVNNTVPEGLPLKLTNNATSTTTTESINKPLKNIPVFVTPGDISTTTENIQETNTNPAGIPVTNTLLVTLPKLKVIYTRKYYEKPLQPQQNPYSTPEPNNPLTSTELPKSQYIKLSTSTPVNIPTEKQTTILSEYTEGNPEVPTPHFPNQSATVPEKTVTDENPEFPNGEKITTPLPEAEHDKTASQYHHSTENPEPQAESTGTTTKSEPTYLLNSTEIVTALPDHTDPTDPSLFFKITTKQNPEQMKPKDHTIPKEYYKKPVDDPNDKYTDIFIEFTTHRKIPKNEEKTTENYNGPTKETLHKLITEILNRTPKYDEQKQYTPSLIKYTKLNPDEFKEILTEEPESTPKVERPADFHYIPDKSTPHYIYPEDMTMIPSRDLKHTPKFKFPVEIKDIVIKTTTQRKQPDESMIPLPMSTVPDQKYPSKISSVTQTSEYTTEKYERPQELMNPQKNTPNSENPNEMNDSQPEAAITYLPGATVPPQKHPEDTRTTEEIYNIPVERTTRRYHPDEPITSSEKAHDPVENNSDEYDAEENVPLDLLIGTPDPEHPKIDDIIAETTMKPNKPVKHVPENRDPDLKYYNQITPEAKEIKVTPKHEIAPLQDDPSEETTTKSFEPSETTKSHSVHLAESTTFTPNIIKDDKIHSSQINNEPQKVNINDITTTEANKPTTPGPINVEQKVPPTSVKHIPPKDDIDKISTTVVPESIAGIMQENEVLSTMLNDDPTKRTLNEIETTEATTPIPGIIPQETEPKKPIIDHVREELTPPVVHDKSSNNNSQEITTTETNKPTIVPHIVEMEKLPPPATNSKPSQDNLPDGSKISDPNTSTEENVNEISTTEATESNTPIPNITQNEIPPPVVNDESPKDNLHEIPTTETDERTTIFPHIEEVEKVSPPTLKNKPLQDNLPASSKTSDPNITEQNVNETSPTEATKSTTPIPNIKREEIPPPIVHDNPPTETNHPTTTIPHIKVVEKVPPPTLNNIPSEDNLPIGSKLSGPYTITEENLYEKTTEATESTTPISNIKQDEIPPPIINDTSPKYNLHETTTTETSKPTTIIPHIEEIEKVPSPTLNNIPSKDNVPTKENVNEISATEATETTIPNSNREEPPKDNLSEITTTETNEPTRIVLHIVEMETEPPPQVYNKSPKHILHENTVNEETESTSDPNIEQNIHEITTVETNNPTTVIPSIVELEKVPPPMENDKPVQGNLHGGSKTYFPSILMDDYVPQKVHAIPPKDHLDELSSTEATDTSTLVPNILQNDIVVNHEPLKDNLHKIPQEPPVTTETNKPTTVIPNIVEIEKVPRPMENDTPVQGDGDLQGGSKTNFPNIVMDDYVPQKVHAIPPKDDLDELSSTEATGTTTLTSNIIQTDIVVNHKLPNDNLHKIPEESLVTTETNIPTTVIPNIVEIEKVSSPAESDTPVQGDLHGGSKTYFPSIIMDDYVPQKVHAVPPKDHLDELSSTEATGTSTPVPNILQNDIVVNHNPPQETPENPKEESHTNKDHITETVSTTTTEAPKFSETTPKEPSHSEMNNTTPEIPNQKPEEPQDIIHVPIDLQPNSPVVIMLTNPPENSGTQKPNILISDLKVEPPVTKSPLAIPLKAGNAKNESFILPRTNCSEGISSAAIVSIHADIKTEIITGINDQDSNNGLVPPGENPLKRLLSLYHQKQQKQGQDKTDKNTPAANVQTELKANLDLKTTMKLLNLLFPMEKQTKDINDKK